jgi:UDP-3-O-[3-hydroxymyristoyl] glucosamine N-acyltransferase
MVRVTSQEVAAHVGGELLGEPGLVLTRIGPLQGADGCTLSFLSNPRYRSQLAASQAGCVLVGVADRAHVAGRPSVILCADPYLAYARVSQWWAAQQRRDVPPGIHPSAVVAASAHVDPSAVIGALAVVEEGARIGARARVGAHCLVGREAEVGADTCLAGRVTLAERCRIGARGLVHPGAVIGADGFGFAPAGGRWEKIEQLAAVSIGDDVEIGANTCIDRGALEDTVLSDGVKLDNLVQIGHNVQVGAHTAMAGCVGVAGSARIGAHCTLGGGAIVLGHLELADHVHVSAATVVTRSILHPGQYTGVFPFDDNAAWEKNAATLRQLHAMRDRLRAIESRQRTT